MKYTEHPYNIRELFSGNRYFIPIYQRNYAWSSDEVNQLIQDTADYAYSHKDWDYYIGTLIVLRDPKTSELETIDGQQRLTTLFIILSAIKNCSDIQFPLDWFESTGLTFRNRDNSCASLELIYNGEQPKQGIEYEDHIISIYNTIIPSIKSICGEIGISESEYVNYLLSRVKLLRIEVPETINKNHYFEVMNSRGVQLEQHEVVKAKLLEVLQNSNEEMHVFQRIWEACSVMEKYVQMNFSTVERNIIFGCNWTDYPLTDFNEIVRNFADYRLFAEEKRQRTTINDILDQFESGILTINSHNMLAFDDDKEDDQFYSVINFQNFLLHVLKIYLDGKSSVRLDDKQLSKIFEQELSETDDKEAFVKGFASCLLECRYLYDKFVLRRQKDQWCLKQIRSRVDNENHRSAYFVRTFGHEEEENSVKEKAIILLSMFHVSTPTMIYKNWLQGVLHFVYQKKGNVSAEEFVSFLESMSRTFMLDKYLAPDNDVKDVFMHIIYDNDCQAERTLDQADWNQLDQGVTVENFIFNLYDYLLWKEQEPGYETFSFSYRTSVEHFYPQHPLEENKLMDEKPLNCFGNLCLISSGINSKFSNNMPEAKYSNFSSSESIRSQSLKLQRMFRIVKNNPKDRPWSETDIKDERDFAEQLFKKYLSPL